MKVCKLLKKSKFRKSLIATAVVAAGILVFTVPAVNNVQRKQARERVLEYEQETNEDGIAVDMLENPYFAEKQPGYFYRKPETITYYSEVTDTKRHAMVFLPADYDEEKEYPVLYLLHGLDGSHRTWRNKSADIIIQNLYYFENIPEMIVVCPNSAVNKEENTDNLDIREKVAVYDLTEQDVVNCLMPYINSHYPVKKGKENTAVAGNSMGGRNALYTAFLHQDLFGYVGAFSSARVLGSKDAGGIMPPLLEELSIDPEKGGFRFLMLCVGKTDQVCGQVTYEIHDYLTEQGVEHIFYDTEGGHQNTVWQNALYNFCRKIF